MSHVAEVFLLRMHMGIDAAILRIRTYRTRHGPRRRHRLRARHRRPAPLCPGSAPMPPQQHLAYHMVQHFAPGADPDDQERF